MDATVEKLRGPQWDTFGRAAPFTIGVEEELLVVDADRQLLPRGPEVARAADPPEGEIVGELFKAMVESNSEISESAGEAVAALAKLRAELLSSGSRLVGTGIHPTALSGEASVQQLPRYVDIESDLRGVLRTPICGQHVHVGMPDRETAVRAYNGIRAHVPVLNALAANSPFWFGEDSGLASARTIIFRSYPRAAMGPAFDDFAHFQRVMGEICLAGGLDDYTQIWWDVRLHPQLGTVEIRAADAQFDLRRAAALAAFTHCLVKLEADRAQERIPTREALAESCFQASRHGLDATLLDREVQPVPARELALRLVEEASAIAGQLRCEHELAQVERIVRSGNGADLQRRAHEIGGMSGLLEMLEEQTSRLSPL